MRVVLWDTSHLGVSKDFAGGFGVGKYQGDGGFRSRLIRRFFDRDCRPVALAFAYLAAILRRLGHEVWYVEERTDIEADLYVFCPSLITLDFERGAISAILARSPRARVVVAGAVASTRSSA